MRVISKKFWLIALGLFTITNVASALCLDGRRPTVRAEYAGSHMVAIGKVISKEDVSAPDDPEGIDKTIYSFKVVSGYKLAQPNTVLKITSENTSSRYDMELGSEHLVFLKFSDDEYFVDSCGNSGETSKRRKIIRQLSSMRHR